MNVRQSLLITLLLLPYGSALASDWVYLGTSDRNSIQHFVDASDIRVTGNIRHVWHKYTYSAQTEKGSGAYSNKWISKTLEHTAFNCSERLWRVEAVTTYYEDGTNSSVQLDAQTKWEPLALDTVRERVMKFICAWSKETP